MLVRFTLTIANFTDLTALYTSVYNIATTAANTNPTKPSGVAEWEIINNTVAGGWSPLTGTSSSSLTVGTGSTYVGNYVGLIAPTPKTGVYKAFELYTTGNTTYTAYGIALARVSQYNGSSISSTTKYGSSVALGATATTTSTAAGCNSLLGAVGGASYCGSFYVNATQNYIWIYCTGTNNLFGCSDLTSGSSFDYDTKSLHFPAAGFYICGGASTGTQSVENYTATVALCSFQRGETNYDFNDVWGTTTQVLNIPNITTGSYTKNMELTPFLPSLPAFGTVAADNTTFKSTWNSDGYFRYSINDVSLYNPWQGYPIRTLYGIKIVGWDRYNTALPPTLQNQQIAVGSQKYWCTTFGTNGRFIVGLAI